jgi:hypothetical protein
VTVPFALSVHTFIKNVGADAGFASIIGLALLVLLYFAQMRETSTLRDRLEDASGRVGQLENRLAHLIRAQSAAAARPPVAPRPSVPLRSMGSAVAALRNSPAGAAAEGVMARPMAALPGAPAGVAAPALASATKLIPTPEVVPAPAAEPEIGVAGVVAPPIDDTVVAAPGELVAANGNAQVATPVGPALGGPALGGPALGGPALGGPALGPVTAGAQLSGEAHAAAPDELAAPDAGATAVAVAPPAAGDAAVLPAEFEPFAPPPMRIGPGGGGGPGAGSPPGGRRRDYGRSSRARRIVLPLVGLALVAAVVIVLLSVTGGATPKPTTSAGTTQHKAGGRHRAQPAPFNPAAVTVAVLNGTSTDLLAAAIANELAGRGYTKGTVANAFPQTQTTTVVGYLPGDKTDAQHVAKALNLSPTAVQAAAQSSVQSCAAGPTPSGATTQSTSCQANVIVTVGSDLASAANTSTG